jgi:thiamine-phosphate pyrophosphorylase
VTRAPRLIVITDTTVAPEPELEGRVGRVLALAEPRTVMVLLRDKELPARARLSLGERLVALCRRYGQWLVVAERLDLAALLGADGIHLGEGSVATRDARRLLPPSAWVSRACHSVDAAVRADADAVLLSPIVAARKGNAALGVATLAEARARLDGRPAAERPLLYALGGVAADTAAGCLARGATGVAVIGAVLAAGREPAPLLAALGIGRGTPSASLLE